MSARLVTCLAFLVLATGVETDGTPPATPLEMTWRSYLAQPRPIIPISSWPRRGGRKIRATISYELTHDFGPRRAGRARRWRSRQDKRARVVALVPPSIPGVQRIHRVAYWPRPERIYETPWGRYAVFVVTVGRKPGVVDMDIDYTLYSTDAASGRGAPGGDEDLTPYLFPESWIEVGDPEIRRAHDKWVPWSGGDRESQVEEIANFVAGYLHPVKSLPERGAVATLRQREGDCAAYTDLFVALCRQRGIPARSVEGLVDIWSGAIPWHAWAEVWFEDRGWVKYDVRMLDEGTGTVDRLPNVHLRMSTLRNDLWLDYQHFMCMWPRRAFRVKPIFRLRSLRGR